MSEEIINIQELASKVIDSFSDKSDVKCNLVVASFLMQFESFEKNIYIQTNLMDNMLVGKINNTNILTDSNMKDSDLSVYDMDNNILFDLSKYQVYLF